MKFVQVRLLTNMSDPFPKETVRERLRSIRLLRGEIAGFRVLSSGRIPLLGWFGFVPSFFSIRFHKVMKAEKVRYNVVLRHGIALSLLIGGWKVEKASMNQAREI